MVGQDYQEEQFQPDPDCSQEACSERKGDSRVEVSATTQSMKKSVFPRLESKGKQLSRNHSHQIMKDPESLHVLKRNDQSGALVPVSRSLQGRQESSNKPRQRSLYNRQIQDQQTIKHSKSSFKTCQLALRIEEKKGSLNLSRDLRHSKKMQLTLQPKTECQKLQLYFYHSRSDLNNASLQQLNRLNCKLRQWTARLNSELDQKINEALNERKFVRLTKEQGAQELASVLQSQLLNNEERMTLIQNEGAKLREKSSQLEQDHELLLMQERQFLKDEIRQVSRSIVLLKAATGKKAGQLVQGKMNSQPKVDAIKEEILKIKAQCCRNEAVLAKLDQKHSQLAATLESLSVNLSSKIEEARQGHIYLGYDGLETLYDDLRHKADRCKTHRLHAEAKSNKQIAKIKHELKLLRNQVAHYERSTEQIEQRISHIATDAIALLQSSSRLPTRLSGYQSFFARYLPQNHSNFSPFSALSKHSPADLPATTGGLVTIKESEEVKTQNRNPSAQFQEAEFQNQFINLKGSNINEGRFSKEELQSQLERQKSDIQNNGMAEGQKEQESLSQKVQGDPNQNEQDTKTSMRRFKFRRSNIKPDSNN